MVEINEDLEKLRYLRVLTEQTGMLHDAQVLHLKYWSLSLTHGTRLEIGFDAVSKVVIFNVTKSKGRKPKNLNDRLSLLEKLVKELLGPSYSIIVKAKDKVLYDGTG